MKDECDKRQLPELLRMENGDAVTAETWQQRKSELLRLLSENLFGFTPKPPEKVTGIPQGEDRFKKFGGKAKTEIRRIVFDTPKGEYGFPVEITVPVGKEKPPAVLLLSFGRKYPVPEEEILDRGYALITVVYEDITPDTVFGDFSGGLAGMYMGGRERTADEWGLVGIWAYGASRVMDYLQTRADIDTRRIAVAGHSRLGKTALWCRAQDPRFFMAYGNDTNYGGCGVIRGHIGEDVQDFLRVGSYNFFCETFRSFAAVPHGELPFDMHFLMACQAPGYVFVTGATEDAGMDPLSEFVSMYAAGAACRLLGGTGLVSEGRLPDPGEPLTDGDMGFYIREGTHFMSREDWNVFLDFFDKKR